jgi:PII-like signaling protein
MGATVPPTKKMMRLTIRARNSDRYQGKSFSDALIELYKKNGISGATVLQGVRGYGARGSSRIDVLGLSSNLPIVIETVDEIEKIQSVLVNVKEIVGNNGLVTMDEVTVF